MRKVKHLLFVSLFVLVFSAPAYSITFTFSANPWAGSFDFTTNTGTVLYTFTLESLAAGESFTKVDLFFGNGPPAVPSSESPIITSYTFDSFVSVPAGMTATDKPSQNRLRFEGGSLGVGGGFSFLVDLTLSQSPFNLSLWDGSKFIDSWSSHDAFSQNYNVFYDDSGSDEVAPKSLGLSPEPGTVMLLGAGLLSMGLAGRIKQRFRGKSQQDA